MGKVISGVCDFACLCLCIGAVKEKRLKLSTFDTKMQQVKIMAAAIRAKKMAWKNKENGFGRTLLSFQAIVIIIIIVG